jgi:hypothetical protein
MKRSCLLGGRFAPGLVEVVGQLRANGAAGGSDTLVWLVLLLLLLLFRSAAVATGNAVSFVVEVEVTSSDGSGL